MARTGMTPRHEFFNPENMNRLLGPSVATSFCTTSLEGRLTKRVELGDGDGRYLVVFDTRYGELQYLAVQAENHTLPGL
jgi:hypothetical protein